MAVAPLTFAPQQAFSSYDFAPLARLVAQPQQQDTTLASLESRYAVPQAGPQGQVPAPRTYAGDPNPSGGSNVQSWYEFARRPVGEGGLGLSHEQAAGKVANLQAESGRDIKPWGVTGDAGTAFGAAQWRNDRFANLQKFALERGLNFKDTATQQAFMRHEYLGSPSEGAGGSSERTAYDRLRIRKQA